MLIKCLLLSLKIIWPVVNETQWNSLSMKLELEVLQPNCAPGWTINGRIGEKSLHVHNPRRLLGLLHHSHLTTEGGWSSSNDLPKVTASKAREGMQEQHKSCLLGSLYYTVSSSSSPYSVGGWHQSSARLHNCFETQFSGSHTWKIKSAPHSFMARITGAEKLFGNCSVVCITPARGMGTEPPTFQAQSPSCMHS